ncbi:MAG: adenine phosphoribosyltransferase [Bacteroidia bacterium]|nr:adenine phosphoribosyltransferase [Bacteroidia bacterium]
MNFTETLKTHIREVPDFPLPGINFKDISPLFLNPDLIRQTTQELAAPWKGDGITKVIGIDSRGFLFGPQMAADLEAGFVMVRKKGKLPPETLSVTYELEYGTATLESVVKALKPGDRVIIHDDLLATGGTAFAAADLAHQLGAEVVGFSFLVWLTFLPGYQRLLTVSPRIHSLVSYDR